MCLVSPAAFCISAISTKLYIYTDVFFCRMQVGLRLIIILKLLRRGSVPREIFPSFPWCRAPNLSCTKDLACEACEQTLLREGSARRLRRIKQSCLTKMSSFTYDLSDFVKQIAQEQSRRVIFNDLWVLKDYNHELRLKTALFVGKLCVLFLCSFLFKSNFYEILIPVLSRKVTNWLVSYFFLLFSSLTNSFAPIFLEKIAKLEIRNFFIT